MIRLINVSKYYKTGRGKKYILKDVTVDFPEKQNIGILGANGAGKSTFLRLLGGIDKPNHGQILTNSSISWPMALSGGFQGSLTGRENAQFVCRIYGESWSTIKNKLAFIHEFSEIGDYFDMPLQTYSNGMKARLSFATSMAFDFDYYLIDEITAVGDQQFKEKSRQALKEKKSSASFIIVSHNLNELIQQCDIGIYLSNEKIKIYDDINFAVNSYREHTKIK